MSGARRFREAERGARVDSRRDTSANPGCYGALQGRYPMLWGATRCYRALWLSPEFADVGCAVEQENGAEGRVPSHSKKYHQTGDQHFRAPSFVARVRQTT